jgi:exonuclease SbcD
VKILHTSDWHLGQSFFTKSRKDEHQAFINWLLAQVAQHQIDAVIIAGDVFDTGTPPSYAREIYNQFVVDLQQLNCVLVVLGGNHDSVSTLNESKQILACLNTFVVASTGVDINEQVFCIPDKSGNPGAILCAVPFIRPRDVLQSSAGESGIDKRQALGEAIKQHYAKLYQLAVVMQQKQMQKSGVTLPIIATGHLTALGVSQSDSVRDIYIGTLDGFAADGFPPADYIALGHIHRPQLVAKTEHIRYSGSPIPLSFDELTTQKQIMLVEFKDGTRHLSAIDVPRFQPMQVIKGDLAAIEQALQQFTSQEQAAQEMPCWLCIEVETQDYLSDLQQRIQSLTEGANVEVLQLRRSRNKQRQLLSQQQRETLAELKPLDVFELRLNMEKFAGEAEQARVQRVRQQFEQILSEAQHQGASTASDGGQQA